MNQLRYISELVQAHQHVPRRKTKCCQSVCCPGLCFSLRSRGTTKAPLQSPGLCWEPDSWEPDTFPCSRLYVTKPSFLQALFVAGTETCTMTTPCRTASATSFIRARSRSPVTYTAVFVTAIDTEVQPDTNLTAAPVRAGTTSRPTSSGSSRPRSRSRATPARSRTSPKRRRSSPLPASSRTWRLSASRRPRRCTALPSALRLLGLENESVLVMFAAC